MSGQDQRSTLGGGSLITGHGASKLVVARSIPFHSLCQHHLLPFHGVAHVGYVPGENQSGLAEFARIVEACSRGIQVQQRMTSRIGLWLQHQLAPRGVGVLVQAVHCCKTARGASSGAARTTTAFFGSLRLSADERHEFLSLATQGQ
jgi:GTP cyclohydrolase I